MKRVRKRCPEPPDLGDFRQKNPTATWDDAHADDSRDGQTIPQICCAAASEDQGGICAYCEKPLAGNHPRVEHFHPKSDPCGTYIFLWENMLAVCDGNCSSEEKTKPRSARLHCDAFKNVQIEAGRLPQACDGWLLNPLHVPTQNMFSFDLKTGELKADVAACARCAVPDNRYASTQELVEKTIEHLNLNAERLCELRRETLYAVNGIKKLLRKKVRSTEELQRAVAERFFSKRWPAFFTTHRCLLGPAAEDYLSSVEYQGQMECSAPSHPPTN